MPAMDAWWAALRRGEWLFEELGPAFRAALLGRLADRASPAELARAPLHRLTALAYGVVATLPAADDAAGLLLADVAPALRDHWDAVIRHFEANGEHRRPSASQVALVDRALARLAERWPAAHHAFTRWISVVCPLAGRGFVQGSHPHAFGCVFVDEQCLDQEERHLAVALVHELAHHELFLLNLHDRLIAPGRAAAVRHAPFQRRERPAIARLHAAHALFRTIAARAALELDVEDEPELLRATADTLAGELTPFAAELLAVHVESPR